MIDRGYALYNTIIHYYLTIELWLWAINHIIHTNTIHIIYTEGNNYWVSCCMHGKVYNGAIISANDIGTYSIF